MFSSRVPADLATNRVGRALDRLRSERVDIIDLTESNPTRVGLTFPQDLLAGLGGSDALVYRPEPLGLPTARAAVSAYLGRHDLAVEPERVVLTASSSDAYGHLFKLLCNPGDAVMVPHPSYPLFEHLIRLEGVTATPYALEYHGRWDVNMADLQGRVTPRTRAVLMVNPNNPTGSFVSAVEFEAIMALCREHDLALIVDEVFGLYPIEVHPRGPSVLDHPPTVLTFSLGGLSKSVGLPQLKLGWIAVGGPRPLVTRALARLELICDTYLSVATPVQLAVGDLLERGTAVTAQIAARVRHNYARLQEVSARHPATRLFPVDGGWYAVVQVPATRSEEAIVLDLLEHERVLAHPGYFFDFPREAFLVVSLLQEPSAFEDAISRVLAHASGGGGAIDQ